MPSKLETTGTELWMVARVLEPPKGLAITVPSPNGSQPTVAMARYLMPVFDSRESADVVAAFVGAVVCKLTKTEGGWHFQNNHDAEVGDGTPD